jgi:DNA-binding transcriptional ArsR family regulator
MAAMDEPFKAISGLFGVLSHPDRLRILSLLKADEMDVSHLQVSLGISQSGVSQHLHQLKHHGLVEQRRAGKHIFYRLKSPKVALVVATALQLLAADMISDGKVVNAISELLSMWGG